ncbi:hypothetical protein MMEU_0001 [Mycobacterium marinum str. Europe]|nr:hypothetical protein MMEU_0001 [Mycobacterium marinum str. Europe]
MPMLAKSVAAESINSGSVITKDMCYLQYRNNRLASARDRRGHGSP